ncbi:YkgJ family cysteine cluster protein [Oceanobacter kriegii]|uniref:YkgJ family cysteine cluster protein n=1 Tax=Oceanobacter kriegii TaxID=64972 RepID=UPI000A06826E|nr:YkgJ family cysteine cluster protein [Oceanobacter kriegii]
MECRLGCGACCIAPSITSAIPGMPRGKPAGVRCVQLSDDNLCQLFGQPERPAVCGKFTAEVDICGTTDQQAFDNLIFLEQVTGDASESELSDQAAQSLRQPQ